MSTSTPAVPPTLARMTLSALEELLRRAGVSVIRVHRSRIVNRAKVREVLPTRNGDFVVRLLDGTEVRGSRRYREILAVDGQAAALTDPMDDTWR